MIHKTWIAPKGYTAPEGAPAPEPMSRADAKQALALALVDVMRGMPMPRHIAAARVMGIPVGSGLRASEVVSIVEEIADEWAAGKGPDVPAYVPPPEPVKPKPPMVIEYDEPPDPKEVPDEE